MVNGLNRLGHDTVIRRNHQNSNIRHQGASGTHCSKGLVPRRIQEGNLFVTHPDTVRTDMLGNTPELTFGYIGISNGIQQRSLTMVNMTHHHNHRGSGFKALRCIFYIMEKLFFIGENDFLFKGTSQFLRNQRSCIIVQCLIH